MLYGNEGKMHSTSCCSQMALPRAQPKFVIFPVMESALTLTIFFDTVHNISLQYILEGRALHEVTEP